MKEKNKFGDKHAQMHSHTFSNSMPRLDSKFPQSQTLQRAKSSPCKQKGQEIPPPTISIDLRQAFLSKQYTDFVIRVSGQHRSIGCFAFESDGKSLHKEFSVHKIMLSIRCKQLLDMQNQVEESSKQEFIELGGK